MDTKTMYNLTYGLFVLTANEDGKDNGCIINTGIQAASDPQVIAFAVNKANLTHDMVMRTKKFTLSILSKDAKFSIFSHFGFQSGREVDKFAGYSNCRRGLNGVQIITEGTNGFISGWVTQTVDLGSHTLFIAAITDMERLSDTPSMDYSYYQSEVKPRPQKVGETPGGQTIWRCVICGYEYVGEELPDDFICPICKHPASDFEKVTK